MASAQVLRISMQWNWNNGPFSSGGQKWALANWSNTWKHACYCAFMYTFTEKHVCFHVISLFSAHFWPHWKGSIRLKDQRKGVGLWDNQIKSVWYSWAPYLKWLLGEHCMSTYKYLFSRISAHLRVSAHPPFLMILWFTYVYMACLCKRPPPFFGPSIASAHGHLLLERIR